MRYASEKVFLNVMRSIFRGHSADLSVPMIFGVFVSGAKLFCTGKFDHTNHSLSLTQ